jgi:hypothetical protein
VTAGPELPLIINRRRCRDCHRALPAGSRMYRCADCVLASIERHTERADR